MVTQVHTPPIPPRIDPGDLVTIEPNTPIYPSAYSSAGAPSSGPTLITTIVTATYDFYLAVILPPGRTVWVHGGSCRLARKADRT
jgi:hypothetical protein